MSFLHRPDWSFYRKVLAISVPMMLQSGITTFVSLLDNIMVGQLGTAEMSGVSIANQIFFVFTMVLFGGMSGAGIFGAQYHGRGDMEGLRNVFRANLWIAGSVSLVTAALIQFRGEALLRLFLHGSDAENLALALSAGMTYLGILKWMLIPFALVDAYTNALFVSGKTVPSMSASMAAVVVNLVLDYVLIFGRLGLPKMGVAGAAWATLMARFVEFSILAGWTHLHPKENPFIQGVYRTLRVPASLVFNILKRGMPLLANEALYSIAVTTMIQCYSLRGLDVVAAVSITATVSELFDIGLTALGNATGVIVGNILGTGDIHAARAADRRLIRFSAMTTAPLAIILFCTAPLFPQMYQVSDIARTEAMQFLRVISCLMCFHAITNSCYFTLRCGGKTVITFLFDCVFQWAVCVPCAWILARSPGVSIFMMYAISQSVSVIKACIGLLMVHSGVWAKVLIKEKPMAEASG